MVPYGTVSWSDRPPDTPTHSLLIIACLRSLMESFLSTPPSKLSYPPFIMMCTFASFVNTLLRHCVLLFYVQRDFTFILLRKMISQIYFCKRQLFSDNPMVHIISVISLNYCAKSRSTNFFSLLTRKSLRSVIWHNSLEICTVQSRFSDIKLSVNL